MVTHKGVVVKISRFGLISVFMLGVFFSGLSAAGTFKTLFLNVDVFLLKSDFNVYDHAQALEKQETSFDEMQTAVLHIFSEAAASFLAQHDQAPVLNFLEHCFGKSDEDANIGVWPQSSDAQELSRLSAELTREICLHILRNKSKILSYESRAELRIIYLGNSIYGQGYRAVCFELDDDHHEQESAEINQALQHLDDFLYGSDGENQDDFLLDEMGFSLQQNFWDDFWAWLAKMRKWLPYMLL